MPTVTPPTFDEQVLRGLAYLFTAGIGAAVLIQQIDGSLIERSLGLGAYVWAAFILTGVPAAVSTVLGRYRYEYALLPCFTGALLVANLATWVNLLSNQLWDVTPRACAASALVLMLSWRWRTLDRLIRVLQWTKPLHRR